MTNTILARLRPDMPQLPTKTTRSSFAQLSEIVPPFGGEFHRNTVDTDDILLWIDSWAAGKLMKQCRNNTCEGLR